MMQSHERRNKLRWLVLCAFPILIGLKSNCASGQTPWATAPAKPANLPPSQPVNSGLPTQGAPSHDPSSVRSLVSLPPPPSRLANEIGKSKPNGLIPAPLRTPDHVPLAGANANLKPAPLAHELPYPALPGWPSDSKHSAGGESLIPELATLQAMPVGGSAGKTSLPAAAAVYSPTTRDSWNPLEAGPSNSQETATGFLGSSPRSVNTEDFDNGQLIAVVGADHVLAGDMAHIVEPIVEQNRDRIRSASEEKLLRTQVIRQVLKHYIEIKAMYQEFFHDMVGTATPDKVDETKKQVLSRANRIFFEKQVPVMLEKYDANDFQELEVKLREKAMSLATMRSTFIEQVLAQELERKYVPDKFEISRDELINYYHKHQSDWDVPATARWQQLTVRFDQHQYDRAAVDALIKQMGNEIYLGGKAFEAVAKQSSEGFTADEGGIYDWTTQGSLKSKRLDQAIFSLELGRLSEVIEDEIGMHIIVVLERTPNHTKDFPEAQAEIREKLSDEKRETEISKFRKTVLARTPVWSLWPDDLKNDIPHVRPLEEAIGEPGEG